MDQLIDSPVTSYDARRKTAFLRLTMVAAAWQWLAGPLVFDGL
jgi:hypothetical protein